MKRVDLRLILVHSIATWLLIYATELFGYLRDIPFLKVLLKGDYNGTVQYITSRGMTASEVIDYAWFVDLIWIAGFLLSLFISLYVGRKRHWWWVNSVIAVVVACIVNFAIGRFYHGENWIGLLIWAVESKGAKVPDFYLSVKTPVRTGRQPVELVDAPSWTERTQTY